MLHNKNKQQQKNLSKEKIMACLNFKKKKKKKKRHNFSMYHAIPWRLLVQVSACFEWLYIENFFGNKQKEKGELASS